MTGSGAAEIFEFVWAYFLSISRANAQKVSFGIFITALHLTTFELLYMLIYSAERPNLACYPKYAFMTSQYPQKSGCIIKSQFNPRTSKGGGGGEVKWVNLKFEAFKQSK